MGSRQTMTVEIYPEQAIVAVDNLHSLLYICLHPSSILYFYPFTYFSHIPTVLCNELLSAISTTTD